MQLASKEKLEREIESLQKKAAEQKLDRDDRIVAMERETETRISQMKAAHEKVCDDLHGFIKTMEGRLAKSRSYVCSLTYNCNILCMFARLAPEFSHFPCFITHFY